MTGSTSGAGSWGEAGESAGGAARGTTKKLGNTDCFSSGCFNNSHYMEFVLTISDSHCIMDF